MDVAEGPSSSSVVSEQTIEAGHTLLLKMPTGDVRPHKIEKDTTVNLGKFGSFHANHLIGQPYGLTYDIVDKSLKVVPPRPIQEVEDTEATNELINDGEFVQPLTSEEIEELKKQGLPADEIVKRQIEQHANYQLKTEYSKEKYKKRKVAKYSKGFSTVIPALYNVCEYWFNKDATRLRDIRPDALSQILNLASIRPGGRYLCVDDASGIVVTGILQRLAGEGRLITICDIESPPAYPCMVQMNFPKEHTAVISSLNWATADEDYTPIVASSEPPTGKFKSEGQKSRLNKRKVASDMLMRHREELFAGEFDGLVIASQYDPWSILERLYPYLGGSASIVVHSPQVQILSDLHAKLRDLPGYLGPSLTEGFLRRYQVLPGRTHPTMNTSGTGGFILHAIKVYDDPNASSVMAHRQKAKKAKLEAEANANAAPATSSAEPERPVSDETLAETTQPIESSDAAMES
ncbi:Gcd10p-domain-containing protein [Phanerochaete sordida]|uniref:tRNA (adenine(58)-N(1))-methyltransferase non-catalytic subunit TRM6 n=1 Tax=Phanerochaete sordida TaxID=48140 RepID=A0A9P3G7D0_9APHY|nr:Gcd10p-domain-containing protein [Phanerochaete sordida]